MKQITQLEVLETLETARYALEEITKNVAGVKLGEDGKETEERIPAKQIEPDQILAALADMAVGFNMARDLIRGVLPVELEIDRDLVANVLCSGIESGIAYWCRRVDFTTIPVPSVDSYEMRRYYQPLVTDGAITFVDHADGAEYQLDRAALLRGIQVMAKSHPRQLGALFGSSDQDARTGDVLIQCALFGKTVYA